MFTDTFSTEDFCLCDYVLFPRVFLSRQQNSDSGHPGGSPHCPGSWPDHLHQEKNSTGPALHQ